MSARDGCHAQEKDYESGRETKGVSRSCSQAGRGRTEDDEFASQIYNLESVMIDGRWTMFHRKLLTIDEKIVLREAKDRAAKIAAQSGLNLSQRFNWV